jgi:SAM-dependent methyltransferase
MAGESEGASGPGFDRTLGRVFDSVADVYDRVRPSYPDELFTDLAAITGLDHQSSILEVGCGTGQATASLAALGNTVTAVEAGEALARLARRRLKRFSNVRVETASFEDWDDGGEQFDLIVAAASWHWIDPTVGWRRAHDLLVPDGWLAVIGNVVVRRLGEVEVYAETADLHEHFCPGNPDWGDPPFEDEIRATNEGWGSPNEDRNGWFGSTVVRWYPLVQWFDGEGFVDLLRSTSLYQKIDAEVREPLLDAIAERIGSQMNNRVPRRYLGVLRTGQRDPDAAITALEP